MNISVLSGTMAPAGITAFMTTARDGVTFNRYGAEDPRSLQSYEQLKKQFGIENLVMLHQQHSVDIVEADMSDFAVRNGAPGDGLFTSESDLALGILTADCYPVMLAGREHIAALHCGWRGTVKGIMANAVRMFAERGDAPEYAYVGAGISKNAFRVQDDFIEKVEKSLSPGLYLSEKNGERYFDLAQLIQDQLRYLGVDAIEYSGVCTYNDSRFHSYRRDGKDAGRMLSVIYRRRCCL